MTSDQAGLGLGTLLAVLAWGGFVTLAVLEGRELRADSGSVTLLALWSLCAVASLYAALVLLVRLRQRRPPRVRGGRHAGPRR